MPEAKTAAIIAGPRWWGDSLNDRDGTRTSKERKAARQLEAKREVEIMQEIVDGLPADCFIIQGGARGADSLAAALCGKRGLNGAGVPYFGNKGKQGGYLRNNMMGILLNGLALQEFKVKVIVVTPPEGITTGTKMMKDIAEKMGIFVSVHPYFEPTTDEPAEPVEETA